MAIKATPTAARAPQPTLDGRPTRATIFLILPITTLAPALGTMGTAMRLLLAVACASVVFRRPARLRVPQAVFLAALVLILATLAVGTPSLAYGITRLANWVMFLPLLFIGASVERLLLVGKSLFVTCWIQIGGVLLQLGGHISGTWGGLLTSGSFFDPSRRNLLTRYTGFVGNPNDLGLLLSLGAVMCVLIVVTSVARRKTLLLVSAGAFVWGVFITGSRGDILGLVVGVIASLIFLNGRQRLIVGTISVLAGAFFLTRGGAVRLVVDSIWAIFAGQDSSAASRSLLWSDKLSANNPWLFGKGFGGYASSLITNSGGLGVDMKVKRSMTIDNGWLKLFLEGGWLVVVVFTLLLVSILAPLLTRHVRASTNLATVSVVFSSLAMILWRSLSVDMFDINPWNALIWLGAGLSVGLAAHPVVSISPWPLGMSRLLASPSSTSSDHSYQRVTSDGSIASKKETARVREEQQGDGRPSRLGLQNSRTW